MIQASTDSHPLYTALRMFSLLGVIMTLVLYPSEPKYRLANLTHARPFNLLLGEKVETAAQTIQGANRKSTIYNEEMGPSTSPNTCTGHALLVTNFNSNNVQRFDEADGSFDSTLVASVGDKPNAIYQNPLPNGPILISTLGGAVYKFDAFTGAAVGAQPFIAAGAPNNLDFSEAIFLGQDGSLYVASREKSAVDGGGVKRFNATTGALIDTFINGGNPMGIAQGSDGSWYVSSGDLDYVRKYNSSGTLLGTVQSYSSGETARGMTIGPDGKLYVVVPTSTGTRIEVFTLPAATPATPTTFLTMDDGSAPFTGILWGPDGNLYIADFGEDEVQVYDATGASVRTIATNLNGPHGVGFTTCAPTSDEETEEPTAPTLNNKVYIPVVSR